MTEQVPALPGSRGLAQAGGDRVSLVASVGGVRGLLESVIPVTMFSLAYGLSHDLRLAVVAALVPALVMAAWRLLAREPLTQAVSGAVAVGIGAVIATRTGRAEDYFVPSLLKNAAFALGYAVSAAIRWPLVGVVVGVALGEGTRWRAVPERRRAYTQVTWLWVGVFTLRLCVQVPLYLAGAAAALGLANVPLGLPLFGVGVWLSWLVLRRVPVVRAAEVTPPSPG
jgi:hypothetical protein